MKCHLWHLQNRRHAQYNIMLEFQQTGSLEDQKAEEYSPSSR